MGTLTLDRPRSTRGLYARHRERAPVSRQCAVREGLAWSAGLKSDLWGLRCPRGGPFGAWVHLGLTGGLASGRSALYTTCRHVRDLVAIR
jgi:hypothetical protein